MLVVLIDEQGDNPVGIVVRILAVDSETHKLLAGVDRQRPEARLVLRLRDPADDWNREHIPLLGSPTGGTPKRAHCTRTRVALGLFSAQPDRR